MRRRFSFITSQSGFFLPYVLFITAIVLFIVTANVNIYRQDVLLTHQHINQLRIETLIQMAYKKFEEEYIPLELDTIDMEYNFPYGVVQMKYVKLDDTEYNLRVSIVTSSNFEYTLLKTKSFEEHN